MFERENRDALALAQRSTGARLPAGWEETLGPTIAQPFLTNQSTSYSNTQLAPASNYAAEIERITGDQTLQPALATGGLEALNRRIEVLSQDRPDLNIKPLTRDEIATRALKRGEMAVADARELAAREKTVGGSLGIFTG